MFTHRITLIRLLGIDVKLDASWIFLALLVTWSLAAGLFPEAYPGLETSTYWLMGIGGALGLFISIIAHEFGHAVVARRYGIPIEDITLFVFGGVANMKREPDRALHEFLMAIAGPIVSVLIALGCYAGLVATGNVSVFENLASDDPITTEGAIPPVIAYLGLINGMLAIFNMIPAFPLDGGRVFRSILWGLGGDIKKATKIASGVGSAFGLFLMFMGVLSFFSGAFIAGVWWFILGLFVRNASAMSYRHLLVKSSLSGRPVSRFMSSGVISVPPQISLRDFVEDYVYRYHHKLYPVMDNGHVLGAITTNDLRQIEPQDWANRSVADTMQPVAEVNSVSKDTDAMVALDRMNENRRGRMLVVDGDRVLGVVALKDLLEYLTLRLDLEPDR